MTTSTTSNAKHYLLNIVTRDGETEYTNHVLLSVPEGEELVAHINNTLSGWYEGCLDMVDPDKVYWFNTAAGTVAVSEESCVELPDADYEVLKKYL